MDIPFTSTKILRLYLPFRIFFRTSLCFLCTLTIICKLLNNCHVNKMFIYFYAENSIV